MITLDSILLEAKKQKMYVRGAQLRNGNELIVYWPALIILPVGQMRLSH